MGAEGKGQLSCVAELASKVEWLAIEVGGQADGRTEAVAPGVESQGQAKDLEELAVVARGVREEFVIHEEEYTPGLVSCKQSFLRIFLLRFHCAWH